MKVPDVQLLHFSYALWERRGCPVGPEHDLRQVWPNSPYGKLRGDPHDSVPSLAEQIKKKKKGKR